MRLAILEAGGPPSGLERFGTYPQMFERLLGRGFGCAAFDVQAGELPNPERFDAALITGSSAGVYDELPWIAPLKRWLIEARGRTKLVGVCFGHQLMAEAFGGRVEQVVRGWGVGLHTYDVFAREPWMDGAAASVSIPVSHQDQVVAPPSRARVVAGSPFGALAYADPPAISLQCHPEFDPAYARALVESRRGTRLTDAQADAATASLHGPDDRARVGNWIGRFLAGRAAEPAATSGGCNLDRRRPL